MLLLIFHALRVSSSIPIPPGPALLCCPGELQGPLSWVLQMVRGSSPTFMTSWTAPPTTKVSEENGGWNLSYPATLCHLMASLWQIFHAHTLRTVLPLPTMPTTSALQCFPSEMQDLFSRVLQLLRASDRSPILITSGQSGSGSAFSSLLKALGRCEGLLLLLCCGGPGQDLNQCVFKNPHPLSLHKQITD